MQSGSVLLAGWPVVFLYYNFVNYIGGGVWGGGLPPHQLINNIHKKSLNVLNALFYIQGAMFCIWSFKTGQCWVDHRNVIENRIFWPRSIAIEIAILQGKVRFRSHAFQVVYNLLSVLSSHLTRVYCAMKPAVNGAHGQPWESGGGGVDRTVTMG